MWYYLFIIFCEIVLCLFKSEEQEIEEKCMCFEKCFGIHKKMLAIIFMRNEIKFYFFGTILKEKKQKKRCRLMVKAFLLLSRKNGAIRTWHSYSMMKIQWYCILIKYYLPCQSIQVIIYGHLKKKLWMIRHLYYTIVV